MNKEAGKSPDATLKTGDGKARIHPVYKPPTLVSYTSEEILEQVGPAQACSPSPCAIF